MKMSQVISNPNRRFRAACLLASTLVCALTVGCGSSDPRFRMNMAYVSKQEQAANTSLTDDQIQNVADTLAAMFGTPDQPFLPAPRESGIDQVLDFKMVEMSAGPVSSDRLGQARGLYREHCVHCHGISGDGLGPTAAFLNPYPRDYRMGTFKFKSTPKGIRPTHDDLKRILINGIPGTAMPSFRLLADDELESLVHYVKYLSVRGEVERRLVDDLALELEEGDLLESTPDYLVDDVLANVAGRWLQAESMVPTIPEPPQWSEEERQVAIARGRDLFYGKTAECIKCHGESQLGDGQQTDYDDWAKDFFDYSKEPDPEVNAQRAAEYVALGGLQPRNMIPRNLRQGVYRGGRRPLDVYLRIHHGIDGTPMPKVAMVPEIPGGLTSDDVWCLVEYVFSLPFETISHPHLPATENPRERM